MNGSPTKSSPLVLLCAWLGVLLVGAYQLLPELSLVDFHREEGRRILPAMEMLASGDWCVPTLWSRPYLSKPPGIYWLLAALFQWSGSSTELIARGLSVGCTMLTASGVLLLGRHLYGMRAAVLAALLFLLALETQAKGRLAEIEAPLTLAIFAALSASWLACRGRPWMWAVAGLGLAASVLLKGPVALLFFLPPLLVLARRKSGATLAMGLPLA
ncbi:MAG: 4-amino-4-deoxy-L-arabinose transferase-like glycosyltransferase, partial [Candidatus Paceibacteria bacterium]